MKPVKTMPRFKCDFCKKRSVESVMEKHERRCYRNPNRFCDSCKNTGVVSEEYDDGYGSLVKRERPCEYCSKFDPKIKEEIEKYEADNKPKVENTEVINTPF